MRKLALIGMILCTSAAQAQDRKIPVEQTFPQSVVNHVLKATSYEKHMAEVQLKRDKQTLRVTRSVKDCIKPGGLIDDEVQMCVNGTREKTW
jgi:hypothetical protein